MTNEELQTILKRYPGESKVFHENDELVSTDQVEFVETSNDQDIVERVINLRS